MLYPAAVAAAFMHWFIHYIKHISFDFRKMKSILAVILIVFVVNCLGTSYPGIIKGKHLIIGTLAVSISENYPFEFT